MGLAGTKVKQRFGLDPRNTNWSNDTSRFGHQYLERMGWKPGKGLGLVEHATTSHVKVSIKDDNSGLGSKLAKKHKTDEFDSGECSGLDVFQRILGRLNGKEEQINKEIERKRKDNIINGKWGIQFIKGEVLQSTWDKEAKKLLDNGTTKKRKIDSIDSSEESETSTDSKQHKKKKIKKDRKEKEEKKAGKENSDIKKDKQKKEKKDKNEKKEKKEKKEKNKRKTEQEVKEVTRDSMLMPKEQLNQQIATRLSVRSKWIKQKRASVMDAKALNEIFMVTS